jgi:response regulator RpfG family c-di-GMP phosphodiesterase
MRESHSMPTPSKVLVVDDNPESRFLLTKTLLRKFPQVMVLECADAGSAQRTAALEPLDVIVLHRTADVIGVDLIRMLREVSDKIPIIMVSGIDRSAEAMAAGANFFLSYDEWLRIGTVVAELLSLPAPVELLAPPTATPFELQLKTEVPLSRVPAVEPRSRSESQPEGQN